MDMYVQSNGVRKWIEGFPKRGRLTFSMAEAENRFPHMTKKAIRSSIYRMIEAKRVYSVWRGFYAIVPDEHALMGFVPPIEYIDPLMEHLGHDYYVGLLSAAAIYGAGHQQPQTLTVITNSNDIRSKPGNPIIYTAKTSIPKQYLIERHAGYGKVTLSSPELTALDLICYENRIGGLNRATEVIGELELDFTETGDDLLKQFKTPIIQRLGFILDDVLGFDRIGSDLYTKAQAVGVHFRKTLLDPRTHQSDDISPKNEKWKIAINCALEKEE